MSAKSVLKQQDSPPYYFSVQFYLLGLSYPYMSIKNCVDKTKHMSMAATKIGSKVRHNCLHTIHLLRVCQNLSI